MSLDLKTMLYQAESAARIAGEEALARIGSSQTSIKNGNELVTEVDSRCQEMIMETLGAAFPQHGVVGEEGEEGRLFKRPPTGGDDLWWVIDPIDGTNNYAVGVPQFSISIGAMFEGNPVIGVIFDPSTQEVFTAMAGAESRANGRRSSVKEQPLNRFTNVALDSHFGDPPPPWLMEVIQESRFRNIGSAALHLAYVARGGYGGMIACQTKLWDVAAGVLIAENAGALVTDWNNQTLWPIDMENYQGTPLPCVIGTPTVHRALMDIMAVHQA